MRFLVGDVFERLADLEDDSVDLVFSSPPFLALRSYLPADHPDKHKEIGWSEANPAAFLDALLDVVEACDRVLAPHGSLCFELGDTYAGSGGGGGNISAEQRGEWTKYKRGGSAPQPTGSAGWPLDKSLTGIPTLFAWSLAYGQNLLNERETPRWRVRNVVPWCRPNPPVGALGDKWRPATSYVVVACKSRTRWFDLDAVRTAGSPNTHARTAKGVQSRPNTGKAADDEARGGNFSTLDVINDTNGAPPLDYLVLPTAPYKGGHYATFPPGLVTPFVESMCPREVCRVCGEPRRRIVDSQRLKDGVPIPAEDLSIRTSGAEGARTANSGGNWRYCTERETLGWTDCGHGDYRQGVVLDPFAGSGTTLMVANGNGRDSVGIDLDARNLDLARERCGMFLEAG